MRTTSSSDDTENANDVANNDNDGDNGVENLMTIAVEDSDVDKKIHRPDRGRKWDGSHGTKDRHLYFSRQLLLKTVTNID